MNAMIEKYGLTAMTTLVTIMFLAMFAGYMMVGHAAVIAFTAIGLASVFGQYNDQFAQEA